MDDIVVEVGDKLPKDIINYMGVLADSNLTIETNKKEHIYYVGDGDKLARAFENLLKNAKTAFSPIRANGRK